jgi:peptide-methionine (S)-S-oxide reductase
MGILDFLFADPAKQQLPSPVDALPGRSAPIMVPGRHTVLGTPVDGPWPAGTRTVTFGMGCFWGAEKGFWAIPGVVTTAVGYAGGSTPNPTYQEVCSGRTGHAEVVRVAYDPGRVPFESLLRAFWEAHDPTQGMRQGNDTGTQYRSMIQVADAEELALAQASRDVYEERLTAASFGRITTEIALAGPFFFAEDYQQEYLDKNPAGYCPDHSTGVACPLPSGVAFQSEP